MAPWNQPEMLRRGLWFWKTSCTLWKLRPGWTGNMAIEFHFGRMAREGLSAGSARPPGATGNSSRAPPSCGVHSSAGSVR